MTVTHERRTAVQSRSEAALPERGQLLPHRIRRWEEGLRRATPQTRDEISRIMRLRADERRRAHAARLRWAASGGALR